MKNLKITKGECKYFVKHRGSTKNALIQVILPTKRVLTIGEIGEDDCTVPECCCTEAHANAKLIADAFNTANKCGKLPSELLAERDELVSALRELMHKTLSLKEYAKITDKQREVLEKTLDNTYDVISKSL